MKVMFILIVIDALGTVTKGLIKGLEDLGIRGQGETIQTTALLRSTRILRRVLETWGDLRRLAVTQTSVKDHQLKLMWKILKEKIIIIIIVIIIIIISSLHTLCFNISI